MEFPAKTLITRTVWAALGAAAAFGAATGPVRAETRSYAVEWFGLASHSHDGDCPEGVNPPTRVQYRKALEQLKYPPSEIEKIMEDFAVPGSRHNRAQNILRYRGRMNGKPVSGYVYPWTVIDPQLNWVKGKYALGFNLDGKTGADAFEEPLTHEKGIDNQLYRALGCIEQFRGTYDHQPTFWAFTWGAMRQSMPAWLISVAGESLDNDGPVTITFDRAIEHLVFNVAGEATADVTYRIDPEERSHHSFKGQIKDGVLSITEARDLTLLMDTLAFPELRLKSTHLRLVKTTDGRLGGLIGGYQPWDDIYMSFGLGGLSFEGMILNDTPGIWYLMKKLADADREPATGQNMSISTAYRIEAVPVFAVSATGEYRSGER